MSKRLRDLKNKIINCSNSKIKDRLYQLLILEYEDIIKERELEVSLYKGALQYQLEKQ